MSQPRLSRRLFLSSTGLAVLALAAPKLGAGLTTRLERPVGDPATLASDEAYWRRVADCYSVDRTLTNLEHGYWGVMSDQVLAAHATQIARVNREGSRFARRELDSELETVRERVAAALGVEPAEIALTRGATEALQNLIGGYRNLTPGDAVLYADLDYHSMQWAMDWLEQRRGVRVVRIAIPEPASRENVVAAYAQAFDQHPGIKLVLLTHVSNRTGLVLPVAEIATVARERGADVILDAAHAWGHVDFDLPSLPVDFVGLNLHKWIGAPLGSGVLYVHKGRLDAIERAMADRSYAADDIRSRVHSGTVSFGTLLAVPAALDFHHAVGQREKVLRLRYLRDRWVGAVRELPGLEILTPDEDGMSGGMTSFRFGGRSSKAENVALVENLLERYGIFTVARTGVAAGDCVRVTPAPWTAARDVDRLAAALRELAAG